MNQNALSLLAVGNANHVIAVKTTQATTQLLIAERSNQVFFSIDGNGAIRSGLANTTFNTGSAAGQSLNWGTSYLGFNARRQNNTWLLNTDGANNGGGVIWGNVAGDIYFAGVPSTGAAAKDLPDAQINSNHTHMVIKGDGNVGIGTKNTYGFKLNVCGKIRAKELNIEANNWCDFVFHEDYVLLPLDARKEHLLLKKHLPHLKPEKEILEQGADVGEILRGLLQNIEELNLYVIQLHERIKELEIQPDK